MSNWKIEERGPARHFIISDETGMLASTAVGIADHKAYLLARGPELLAMLQRMVEYYDYDMSESGYPEPCPAYAARMLVAAVLRGDEPGNLESNNV